MHPQQATKAPSFPTWGSFALVTYLPDPLGVFLTQLRHLLPGETRPDAHITFLPPRPLALDLETAAHEVRRILSDVQPFEIELGSVQVFPETGMLYLSVEAGHQQLLHLHDSLNCGKLFSPEHFAYTPHLTLGGPVLSGEIETILHRAHCAWANTGISPRFLVQEMVLLWQPGDCSENGWTRISAYPIGHYSNIGI